MVNFIIKSIKNNSFLKDKKNYHKIYNVGNNKNISTINFVKLIEKNLNKTSKVIKLKIEKQTLKTQKQILI